MSSKEVLEGNNLIAEFMGWKLHCYNPSEQKSDRVYEFHLYNESGEVIDTDFGGDSWCWNEGDTLPFHAQWNLLMPVVEKIESLGCIVEIWLSLGKGCRIIKGSFKNPTITIANTESNSTIDAVYEAVIEFIKWSNQNK